MRSKCKPGGRINKAEMERRCCARGHECPGLYKICGTFQLEPEEVLNVYVAGSHMWETCNRSSDWDIVVIVKHLKSPKPQNVHKGSLEAFILSREQYRDQLDSHSMQLLVTLWIPQQCVIQQALDPKTDIIFSEQQLVMSLMGSRDRDLKIAEKHFRKGDNKGAKKILVHCIRYLDLGVQIRTDAGTVSEGRCLNYSSTNLLREQVLSNYSKSWEELMISVQPMLDDLWSRLTK